MSYKGVFIIDGTGDGDDKKYFDVMKESFCSMLYTKLSGTQLTDKSIRLSNNIRPPSNANFFVRYSRGPELKGFDTESLANDMIKQIELYVQECKEKEISPEIYLVGHSRGGVAVIYIAKQLKNSSIKAMFLFDAVDRYLPPLSIATGILSAIANFLIGGVSWIPFAACAIGTDILDDTDNISNNVEICYHARRDPNLNKEFETLVSNTSPTESSRLHNSSMGMRTYKTEELSRGKDSRTRQPLSQIPQNTRQPLSQIPQNTRQPLSQIPQKEQEFRLADVTSRNDLTLSTSIDEISIPFGNCGTNGSKNYKEKSFMGTHGAIGGTPTALSAVESERKIAPKSLEWRNIEEQAVYDVDEWMSQHLKSEGIFPQYTSTLILNKNIIKFEEKMLMQEKKMCSPKPSLTNTDILNSFLDFKPPK